MKDQLVIEMGLNEKGVYIPVGEEKRRRAEKIHKDRRFVREQQSYQRRPVTFLEGFNEGLKFIVGARRRFEEFLYDALGEEDRGRCQENSKGMKTKKLRSNSVG